VHKSTFINQHFKNFCFFFIRNNSKASYDPN